MDYNLNKGEEGKTKLKPERFILHPRVTTDHWDYIGGNSFNIILPSSIHHHHRATDSSASAHLRLAHLLHVAVSLPLDIQHPLALTRLAQQLTGLGAGSVH
jgi:hypothetical protein